MKIKFIIVKINKYVVMTRFVMKHDFNTLSINILMNYSFN